MTTTQRQPKPNAQDEQGEEQQHSGTEEPPNIAPLRFIEQLVDSASSLSECFKHGKVMWAGDDSVEYKFAVVIWGPSDVTTTGGKSISSPRDNVIFEAGRYSLESMGSQEFPRR